MPDIATLGIDVRTAQAEANTARLDGKLKKLGITGKNIGGTYTQLGITLAAAFALRKTIQNTADAQQSINQLEAVIESTGGAAGVTVRELDEMADALQRVTRFSDEATQGAQAVLLTFRNLGSDVFERATEITLDLAQALGTDLNSAAIQVGKALNDPAIGLTALSRSGITFSDTQADLIKNLFEVGKQAEAQTLILDELELQFGGSARAAREDLGGALAFVKNQLDDFFEVGTQGSAAYVDGLNAIGDAIPQVKQGLSEFLGGIQLLAVDAAIAFARVEVGIARILDKVPSVLDLLAKLPGSGFGEGRGLFDPLSIIDTTSITSLEDAEAALQSMIDAEDELKRAIVEGGAASVTMTKERVRAAEAARLATAAATSLAVADRDAAAAALEDADARGSRLVADVIRIRREAEVIQRREDATAERARARRQRLREQNEAAELASAKEAVAIYAKAAEEIQQEFANVFDDIFTDGVGSFEDLAVTVLDIFTGIAAEIAGALAADAIGLDDLLADLRDGKKLSGGLGLGIAGGAGLGIGFASRSKARGAIGGAAAGFAVGGPVGAAVGALGGFVGGLFGAKKAAEELRAEHFELARQANEERKARREAEKVLANDFLARGLALTGQGDEAARARLREQQRREVAEGGTFGPLRDFVHALETMALENEILLRDQTEAITTAADLQIAALDESLDIARQQLRVAEDSLREQERTVSELRSVIESLSDFSASLDIGDFSPLSPTARLAEARRQFEETAAAARGGDLEAAGNLPAIARAVLAASREVNASGLGFVADFDAIKEALSSVTLSTAATLSVEDRILAELESQSSILRDQIVELEAARDQAQADAVQQIQQLRDLFEAELAALAEQLAELQAQTDVLREPPPGPARDIDEEIRDAINRGKDESGDLDDSIRDLGDRLGDALDTLADEQRGTTRAITKRLDEGEVITK